jgi:hypothetical protein
VYDLTLRHYLMFTASIDARRQAAKEATRG